MDRLFGRHGSQAAVEAVLYEPRRRDPAIDPRPWDGVGGYRSSDDREYFTSFEHEILEALDQRDLRSDSADTEPAWPTEALYLLATEIGLRGSG